MNKINTNTSIIPKNKQDYRVKNNRKINIERNNAQRKNILKEKTGRDAKVHINDAIKDFSKIKRAVDKSPAIDKSDKVAQLKAQIEAGKYKIDYDAVAEKMLKSEY